MCDTWFANNYTQVNKNKNSNREIRNDFKANQQ